MTRPSYAEMSQLLADLGYTRKTIPGSHILFEYPEPNRPIVVRLYRNPEDPFDLAELAYVRSALDAWGILDKEEFDAAIQGRTQAG